MLFCNFYNLTKRHSFSDVANVLIIKMKNGQDDSFDLITSQFTGRYNNSHPIYLDTYYGLNRTFQYGVNLFPDKLTNLEKRNVTISIINYKPYAIWKEVVSKREKP